LEGAELMSQGTYGKIYYKLPDQIVKTYIGATAADQVQAEYERSRTVFAMGVPCAIPFGIVRTPDGPGLLYERVMGGSLAKNMARTPEKLEEYLDAFVELARQMWGTEVEKGVLPDAKTQILESFSGLEDYVGEAQAEELRDIVAKIPDERCFLHMDFHWCNVMYQNGECLLIDLPDAAVGHPILDFSGFAHAYYLAPRRAVMKERYTTVFRITREDGARIWDGFCRRYFGTLPEEVARDRRRAAEISANLFVIRNNLRMLRENYPMTEEVRAMRKQELTELVEGFNLQRDFFLETLRSWKL